MTPSLFDDARAVTILDVKCNLGLPKSSRHKPHHSGAAEAYAQPERLALSSQA